MDTEPLLSSYTSNQRNTTSLTTPLSVSTNIPDPTHEILSPFPTSGIMDRSTIPPSSTTISSSGNISNIHRKSNLFVQDMLRAQNPMLVLEYRIGWLHAKYRYMRRAEILYECRKGVFEQIYQSQNKIHNNKIVNALEVPNLSTVHSPDRHIRRRVPRGGSGGTIIDKKAVTLAPEYRGQGGRCRNTIMTLIQPRDLRVIDPEFSGTVIHHHEPVILVRRHCIIISFPYVRAIILADRCYFFPEKGADNELLPILERFHEFGKQYQLILTTNQSNQNIDNLNIPYSDTHVTNSLNNSKTHQLLPTLAPPTRSLPLPIVHPRTNNEDTELPPFEMYALETFLVQAIATLGKELSDLQPIINEMLVHVSCGIHNSSVSAIQSLSWNNISSLSTSVISSNVFNNNNNNDKLSWYIRLRNTFKSQKALMEAVSIHSFDQIRRIKHKVNDIIHRIEAVERVLSELLDTPQDLASMSLSAIQSIIMEENEEIVNHIDTSEYDIKDNAIHQQTNNKPQDIKNIQSTHISTKQESKPIPVFGTIFSPKSGYHQYLVKNMLDYTHGREHGQSIGTILQSPRNTVPNTERVINKTDRPNVLPSVFSPRRKLFFSEEKKEPSNTIPSVSTGLRPLIMNIPESNHNLLPEQHSPIISSSYSSSAGLIPPVTAIKRPRMRRKYRGRQRKRHHHRKRSNVSSRSSSSSKSLSSSASTDSSSTHSSHSTSSSNNTNDHDSIHNHPLSTSTITNYDYAVYGEAAEILLEAYLAEIETLLSSSKLMKEETDGIESQMTLILADARNQLLRVEIWINTVTMGCTFITVIASFFGMNIRNGYEHSTNTFIAITLGSTIMAGIILSILFWYLRRYMR